MWRHWHDVSNYTVMPSTRYTVQLFPILMVTQSIPCTNRTVSQAISFRGIIPCRLSAVRWGPCWRWEIIEGYLVKGSKLEKVGQGEIVSNAPSGGAYVSPTLFANVQPDHALSQDEILGPVQVIIPFADEEEAVEIANGTKFGLVASIWNANGARQMRLAK